MMKFRNKQPLKSTGDNDEEIPPPVAGGRLGRFISSDGDYRRAGAASSGGPAPAMPSGLNRFSSAPTGRGKSDPTSSHRARAGTSSGEKPPPSSASAEKSSLFGRRLRNTNFLPSRSGGDNSASINSNSNTKVEGASSTAASLDGARKRRERKNEFRVVVPVGVLPGDEFQVFVNGRGVVTVRCPVGKGPGDSVFIPGVDGADGGLGDDKEGSLLTDGGKKGEAAGDDDDAVPPPTGGLRRSQSLDSPNIRRRWPDGTVLVTIPPDVSPGMDFPFVIDGKPFEATCPPNGKPGKNLKIRIPSLARPEEAKEEQKEEGKEEGREEGKEEEEEEEKEWTFEVRIPSGVNPGDGFTILAEGVRVLLTCPEGANAGSKIRFSLPPLHGRKGGSAAAQIRLSYDSDDFWTRTIRISDMKFVWIRTDDKGDVYNNKRFDVNSSAYVRKLIIDPSGASRVRLVPAAEAEVASNVKDDRGKDIVSYRDIADVHGLTFREKEKWFRDTCNQLRDVSEERTLYISRDRMIEDSMDIVNRMGEDDFHKLWRIKFVGEEGLDFGGLTREWFELLTEDIFDPNRGLWQSSATNQMCMQINTTAATTFPDEYLLFFRFIGRLMGRALFDGQLIRGHMVQYLYKHLLGWPITFEDLKALDETIYNNLKSLTTMDADTLEMMCLDFTATEQQLGNNEQIDLVENGADKEVSEENLPEFLEANLRYRLMDRIQNELTAMLKGFFDVIPEPLLTVFDYQELELLMCGLPVIDVFDWRANTAYMGLCAGDQESNYACRWFWEIVDDYDEEMKARLLQFVTGTSGVPPGGFGVLQGTDGNIRHFTIDGVSAAACKYPRAHTCFNRIDLPLYDTKEEMEEHLKAAIIGSSGFGLE